MFKLQGTVLLSSSSRRLKRLHPCSEQGTQAHTQSLSRNLSPFLTFPPGPGGGKAQQAEHRTAPQVRAVSSSISSSISSQLPRLLQDVGIFVMEILYNITTGPKAAYTGPQLNSAAGTEHILLELNLTSRVQQATKQTLKASKQDAFPFPDTE